MGSLTCELSQRILGVWRLNRHCIRSLHKCWLWRKNKTKQWTPKHHMHDKKDYIKDSVFHQKYCNKQAIFVSRTNYAQGSPIETTFCFFIFSEELDFQILFHAYGLSESNTVQHSTIVWTELWLLLASDCLQVHAVSIQFHVLYVTCIVQLVEQGISHLKINANE